MLPELSPKVVDLIERVSKFMDENIYPNEDKIEAEIAEALSDGVISEEEQKHIDELRKKLNLSEEHVTSITEILQHERSKK